MLKHFTVDDGLPSSMIYSAIQDEKGYLWFATEMGLSKFDGIQFKNFTIADGLLFNDVTDLYADSKDRIWLSGFGDQAMYLKAGEFHALPWPSKQAENKIFKYKEDEWGNIWAFNGGQLVFLLTQNGFVKIEVPKGGKVLDASPASKKYKTPIVILKDEKGTFLWRPDEQKKKFVKDTKVFSQQEGLQAPLARGDLPLWLDDSGLIYFDGNGLIRKSAGEWIALNSCVPAAGKIESKHYRISSISEKFLFVKTRRDQFITDLDFNCLSNDHFLSKLNIGKIFQDANKNLWLLTKDDGLYFKIHHNFELESNVINLLENEGITALDQDKSGKIWAGTLKGNLYAIPPDATAAQLFTKRIGLRKNKIRHLQCTEYRMDFVITQHGALSYSISDFESKKWKIPQIEIFDASNDQLTSRKEVPAIGSSFQVANFSPKSSLRNGDSLLLASSAGLILIYEKESQFQISKLTNNRCYAVVNNRNGGFWIGQPDGLFKVSDERGYEKLLEEKKAFPILKKEIRDLAIGQEGALWVATDGYGVYQYHEGTVRTFPELGNKIIKYIFVDAINRIWLATNEGLILIQKLEREYQIKRITTSHGLLSNEVNCVFVDDQKIFAGTAKGLSYIEYASLDHPECSAPLNIERILINGKDKGIHNHFSLKHFENRLLIEYMCPSMESAGHVTYEYKMEGLDTTWHSTKETKLEYTYLPSGKNYRFQLRAFDVNNILAKQAYQIDFEIKNPWWKNKGLLLAVFLWLALLIYLIVRSRFKQLQKKNEKENEVNKKIAELELQALQAQMNPHFIFNALQAIQEIVARQDVRSANKYLSSFSKLMRLFLESSKEKYISLEDELTLLENYILLEQLRFDPPFEFVKKLSPNISTSTVEIPSMLLQPFVENAINHGLRYKKEKGLLFLEVLEVDAVLKIRILDNGVGRKRSAEIQKQATKSYKSRAISITKQRLETIRALQEMNVTINILDSMQEGKIIGTEVQIDLSLID